MDIKNIINNSYEIVPYKKKKELDSRRSFILEKGIDKVMEIFNVGQPEKDGHYCPINYYCPILTGELTLKNNLVIKHEEIFKKNLEVHTLRRMQMFRWVAQIYHRSKYRIDQIASTILQQDKPKIQKYDDFTENIIVTASKEIYDILEKEESPEEKKLSIKKILTEIDVFDRIKAKDTAKEPKDAPTKKICKIFDDFKLKENDYSKAEKGSIESLLYENKQRKNPILIIKKDEIRDETLIHNIAYIIHHEYQSTFHACHSAILNNLFDKPNSSVDETIGIIADFSLFHYYLNLTLPLPDIINNKSDNIADNMRESALKLLKEDEDYDPKKATETIFEQLKGKFDIEKSKIDENIKLLSEKIKDKNEKIDNHDFSKLEDITLLINTLAKELDELNLKIEDLTPKTLDKQIKDLNDKNNKLSQNKKKIKDEAELQNIEKEINENKRLMKELQSKKKEENLTPTNSLKEADKDIENLKKELSIKKELWKNYINNEKLRCKFDLKSDEKLQELIDKSEKEKDELKQKEKKAKDDKETAIQKNCQNKIKAIKQDKREYKNELHRRHPKVKLGEDLNSLIKEKKVFEIQSVALNVMIEKTDWTEDLEEQFIKDLKNLQDNQEVNILSEFIKKDELNKKENDSTQLFDENTMLEKTNGIDEFEEIKIDENISSESQKNNELKE
jgi:hypothetical protein